MNIKKPMLILLLSVFSQFSMPVYSQSSKPDSAQNILNLALKNAESAHKDVFVIFHASWCSWCKRLETMLGQSEIKKIIDDNYVVSFVDVLERGEKRQILENPGGSDAMKEYNGENSGLPFYAFLDENGKVIGTSNVMPDSQNIGYPGSKEEIDAFVTLLRKTAPNITLDQSEVIKKYLDKDASH